MNRIVGIACLAIGIMLLVWGHNSEHAPFSTIKNAVTGTPTDRTMYFYIGGAALTCLGIGSLIWKR